MVAINVKTKNHNELILGELMQFNESNEEQYKLEVMYQEEYLNVNEDILKTNEKTNKEIAKSNKIDKKQTKTEAKQQTKLVKTMNKMSDRVSSSIKNINLGGKITDVVSDVRSEATGLASEATGGSIIVEKVGAAVAGVGAAVQDGFRNVGDRFLKNLGLNFFDDVEDVRRNELLDKIEKNTSPKKEPKKEQIKARFRERTDVTTPSQKVTDMMKKDKIKPKKKLSDSIMGKVVTDGILDLLKIGLITGVIIMVAKTFGKAIVDEIKESLGLKKKTRVEKLRGDLGETSLEIQDIQRRLNTDFKDIKFKDALEFKSRETLEKELQNLQNKRSQLVNTIQQEAKKEKTGFNILNPKLTKIISIDEEKQPPQMMQDSIGGDEKKINKVNRNDKLDKILDTTLLKDQRELETTNMQMTPITNTTINNNNVDNSTSTNMGMLQTASRNPNASFDQFNQMNRSY
jgi:hypothetical protein